MTRASELESSIIRYIGGAKKATRKDVRVAVKANAQKVNRALDGLAERGLLVCTGSGKNSDPLFYSLAELTTERLAA